MTAPGALTDQDVVAVREQVAAEGSVTVWFTAAAVGVPAGGSAKVVSVGDTVQGDFIQVRPAGSRDTVFCSPNELTRTRPARRRVGSGDGRTTARSTTQPAPTPTGKPAAQPAGRSAPKPPPAPRKAATQDAETPAREEPASSAATARPARPARAAGPRRRTDGSPGMSITLTATADGEWTVEVAVGRKRVVPATPVAAAEVVTVARSLPPAVAEAIESSLEGARQRQRERVERLRAELDLAQRVLDQLGV